MATNIPDNVLSHLADGFIREEARWAVKRSGATRGNFDHAGDPFGLVLSWLWQTQPTKAVNVFADYVHELRELTEPNPITLDDALGALDLATTVREGMSRKGTLQAFKDRARTDVPGLLGYDPS